VIKYRHANEGFQGGGSAQRVGGGGDLPRAGGIGGSAGIFGCEFDVKTYRDSGSDPEFAARFPHALGLARSSAARNG